MPVSYAFPRRRYSLPQARYPITQTRYPIAPFHVTRAGSVPNRTDSVPTRASSVPNRADSVHNRTDSVPNRASSVPNRAISIHFAISIHVRPLRRLTPGVCLRDSVSVDLSSTNSGLSTDAQQRSQSRAEIDFGEVFAWGHCTTIAHAPCGTR